MNIYNVHPAFCRLTFITHLRDLVGDFSGNRLCLKSVMFNIDLNIDYKLVNDTIIIRLNYF